MSCTPFSSAKNNALIYKKIATKKHLLPFFFFASSSLFILGCDPEESSSISTGTFVDSPVEGLTYITASGSGTTNADGEFQYFSGENITFLLGSIELPEIEATSTITPLDIFSTTDTTDTQVVNFSRLLQTLDTNQNQTDGIELDTAGLAATEGLSIDFSSLSFDFDILPVIEAMPDRTELVSSTEAIYHLRTSLPYKADDYNGSWLFQTLQTPELGALNPDSFELVFEQAQMSELGVNSITKVFSNPDTLDTTYPYNLSLTLVGTDRGEITDTNDTFDFAYLSASKDIAVGVKESETEGTQSLSLAVKGLVDFSLDKLVGDWSYFSLQTPNNGNGDPSEYGYSYQSVTIDSSAEVSSTVIASYDITSESSDSYSLSLVESSVDMTLVRGDGDFFATNSEFTVLISPNANTSNNQFRFLLKQGESYSQDDLTGSWFGASISTPSYNQNSSAYFGYEAIRLTFDDSGKVSGRDLVTGTLIDMHNLVVTLSSDGSFSFDPALSDRSYWAMDESKTMIAILTVEGTGSQTLTLLLKQGDGESSF